MKNIFKYSLFTLSGVILGASGIYFYAQAADDSVTASITIPATLTIADDGVNFNISNLTPEVVDTSQSNTISLSSNDPDGFVVQMDLDDLDTTAGQLCNDAGGGTCGTNVFDGDGTASYVSFTSNSGAGNLGTLTGATFTNSETKLGAAGSYQVFEANEATNTDSFEVDYDAYADNTIVPDTYEGALTFTIVAQ